MVSELSAKARANPSASAYNLLGIMYAKFNQLPKAKDAFAEALVLQADMVNARTNMASVLYLSGDPRSALLEYGVLRAALEARKETSSYRYLSIILNMAQCHYDIGELVEANTLHTAVEALDPVLASRYTHLQAAGTTSERASGVDSAKFILFIDTE
jgi:tetratricopeptide (TPR) repeat protein